MPNSPKKKVEFIATLPAKNIYDDLIKRIKAKVKSEESIVFDESTGIQKCFLHGKLLWVKHVRGSGITFQGLQPCKSPYCECDVGKCTHPGFYDARGK
jgi:hypothetical protein